MTRKKITATTHKLSEIVSIQAGYPFRGSVPYVENGTVRVVQAKDITPSGELVIDDLITSELQSQRSANWLAHGDVLFISKGIRQTATCVQTELSDTLCSPSLYLLRAKPEWRERLCPLFLTWQLNQTLAQTYFKKQAEGSGQIHIRKAILADLAIALPDIEKQQTIAKMYNASLREQAVFLKLMKNRQRQFDAIITDLLPSSSSHSNE